MQDVHSDSITGRDRDAALVFSPRDPNASQEAFLRFAGIIPVRDPSRPIPFLEDSCSEVTAAHAVGYAGD
jgi:hypothetical protein